MRSVELWMCCYLFPASGPYRAADETYIPLILIIVLCFSGGDFLEF